MTLAIDTADLVRRRAAGQPVTAIALELGVSSQVVSYRLKVAGVPSTGRKNSISPARIRALRDNFGTLCDLCRYLERKRAEMLAKMGDTPGQKTLDNLGQLTDYINVLQDVTGEPPAASR